jgi:prevent-host-death family protein
MTIHVNIGEAKTRLSQLIAAAKRGEKVIIASNGEPVVELLAVNPERDKAQRRARLEAFMGSVKGKAGDLDAFLEPYFTEEELDAIYRVDL